MKSAARLSLLAALILAALRPAAFAAEGGSQNIGLSAEGFFFGALPPAGNYMLLYYNHYAADSFQNTQRQNSIPGFKATVDAAAPRLLQMTNFQVLGGRFGWYAALPVLDVQVSAAGTTDRRTAIGDPIIGPVVSWSRGTVLNGTWLDGAGIDLVLPFGAYDKTRLANAGNHYASIRPIYGFSYLRGPLELSAKISYTFNFRNSATAYTSGQLLHFDYSASWGFNEKWRAGVGGYYVHQMRDDKQYGLVVGDGVRMNALGIGPELHYQAGPLAVELKVLGELAVENKTQGASTWVKAVWPL